LLDLNELDLKFYLALNHPLSLNVIKHYLYTSIILHPPLNFKVITYFIVLFITSITSCHPTPYYKITYEIILKIPKKILKIRLLLIKKKVKKYVREAI
jgi:hypothetical protein